MATLALNDLGYVRSEKHSFRSTLDVAGMPGADSSYTEIYDEEGVVRVITIQGVYKSTTQDGIYTGFIDNIQALMDGDQSTPIAFVSGIGAGTIQVYIRDFDYEVDEGQFGRCNYTLTLVEGTT